MEMTEIRKQSLGVLDKVDEVLASLAEQAKEVLGYDVLQKFNTAARAESGSFANLPFSSQQRHTQLKN